MKIYTGSDHAGFELKKQLKKYLTDIGYSVEDLGSFEYNKKDDYPEFGHRVAKAVSDSGGKATGVLFCGSAEGMCIVANKVKGIRAVAVTDEILAKKSREHNNSNVLCLSGWYLKPTKAKRILKTWLETKFSRAKRHHRRVNQIKKIEKNE